MFEETNKTLVPNEWSLIRDIAFEELDLDKLDDLRANRNELYREIYNIIRSAVNSRGIYLSTEESSRLCDMLCDEINGYGPLRELMEDESVSDILVNGPESIFVERFGKLEKTNKFFINNKQLTEVARRLVNRVGKNIDDTHPLVDARMPDGSRLNVVIPPVALDGASLSIRKFGKGKKSLGELVRFKSMNEAMANFLVIAAKCRMNIIVSGGTGSGKTTLLNALSQFIDNKERIVTLEDAAELRLQQPHVVRMETRIGGEEGRGRVTMRDLLVNSLRMRPDRIIVGECRGEEAFEMLQAMNTGHDGSMSTLHANTPKDALARLESMVMMAQSEIPLSAIRRYITSAVNIIIQAARLPDGSRKIMNITEIVGIESDQIVAQDIFRFEVDEGRDFEGKLQGKFICNGLLKRSKVYENASYHEMTDSLTQLFNEQLLE
ncbi:CpaF family protein [Zophobihabitans entericus]|uniref:CpaF family protein n=1 Tax=Zophobihabitans entericus TaxID=1635327 RepID=A0A6G9IC77_9GAMM|nr:CpaF family protein [Zophobihabitans entericus]QIQ21314.1 CpaF family protein [Zophobihabitans entericus]